MSDNKIDFSLFPSAPGIYIMRGQEGEILYVGKAKSLRKRLASYAAYLPVEDVPQGAFLSKKTALMSRVVRIETILTEHEQAALLLEQEWIKKYRPRFNVLLKDDKNYPFIGLSADRVPRLVLRHDPAGLSWAHGPYPPGMQLRSLMLSLEKLFHLRSCSAAVFGRARRLERPCMQYALGRCSAPCVGRVSAQEYAEQLDLFKSFMMMSREDPTGRMLMRQLEEGIQEAAARWDYEKAQYYRDVKKRLHLFQRVSRDILRKKEESVSDDLGSELSMPVHADSLYQSGWRGLEQILGKAPGSLQRVESMDVSHWQGKEARVSVVPFGPEGCIRSEKRVFLLKKALGGDDKAALEEGFEKRISSRSALAERPPDLIVVDGGEIQRLAISEKVAEHPAWGGVTVWSIVKGEGRKACYDRVLRGGLEEPIREEAVRRLLQRMRDGAHDAAMKAHRRARRKTISRPVVVVEGFSDTRWRRVLAHCGGWQGLMQASLRDLEAIPGIGRHLAARLYHSLHTGA